MYLSMTKDKLFKYAICSKKNATSERIIIFVVIQFILCVEGIGLPEQTHSELRKLRNRESCGIHQ